MVNDYCDMTYFTRYCIQHPISQKVGMIEYNFLQICQDDKIVFQMVANIRFKMEGIS